MNSSPHIGVLELKRKVGAIEADLRAALLVKPTPQDLDHHCCVYLTEEIERATNLLRKAVNEA